MRFRISEPLSNLRFLLTVDLRNRFAEQQNALTEVQNALTEIKAAMFDLRDRFAEQQIMVCGRLDNFFKISLQNHDIDTELLATMKRALEGQKGTIQVVLEEFKDQLSDLIARSGNPK